MDNIKVEVKRTVEISPTQIEDLICTAIEGGVGYWACLGETRYPDTEHQYKQWRDHDADDWVPRYVSVPMSQSGNIKIMDAEDETSCLGMFNLPHIIRGLELLANNHPSDFEDVINGDYDANTADTFFQLAVLGEVVYG